MRVAREIGQDLLRAGEGLFGKDDPFALAQWREVGSPRVGVFELAEIGEELQFMAACMASRACRNRRRNRRESTRTGRKKPLRQAIQRSPSGDSPPAGTMQCTCGWCWRFWPQVCKTAVTPMSAPRCWGSPAIVVSVLAAAVNSNP